MSNKKLVIFDMDGVLVDTEPEYKKINGELFKKLGIEVSLEEQYKFVGTSSIIMWTTIKNKFNLKQSTQELMDVSRSTKHKYLKNLNSLVSIDGIHDLMEELTKNKFIICLASSSPRINVEVILKKVSLMQYFQNIVCGEDVKNGKPNPDIFLKAAEKFNASPSDCTIIEDSHNGITGGKAAGMKCVGFRNLNSGNQDLSKADIIIDAFDKDGISKIIKLASI